MFRLFKDRPVNFEAKIRLEGASFSNSSCRLVVESKDWNFVFPGKIDMSGNCVIPIKKMSILPEGNEGSIKLEVIADDTFFTPWKDVYTIVASKKVQVEVKEQTGVTSKPQISAVVETTSKKPTRNVITKRFLEEAFIISELQDAGINSKNLKQKKRDIARISKNYGVTHSQLSDIIKKVINL